MHTWPVQDAKARFSELLDTCLAQGPQVVTKRGVKTAVLVSADDWQRLQAGQQASLKDLLLAPEARAKLTLPTRGKARRRAPQSLA